MFGLRVELLSVVNALLLLARKRHANTSSRIQNGWGTLSGSQKAGETIECKLKRHVTGIKQMICF